MARTFWSPVILWLSGVKIKVKGLDNLAKNQPYIFVSNHQSLLDIPALFSTIPLNLHFLGKAELKKIPFLGWFMRTMGMVFIERGDPQKSMSGLYQAANLVRQGNHLVIFPEGTRSKTNQIKSFKKGTFLIAKMALVPLVPIKISGANEILSAGKRKVSSGTISILVGKPFLLDYNSDNLVELANITRNKVIELN